jgi:hypothetical protein
MLEVNKLTFLQKVLLKRKKILKSKSFSGRRLGVWALLRRESVAGQLGMAVKKLKTPLFTMFQLRKRNENE